MKVRGLEQAQRKFKNLASAAPSIAQATLGSSGEILRQDMFNKCPVKGGTSADGYYVSDSEPSSRSGATRNSIKVGTPRTDSVRVGTNSPIATDIEYGTTRESAKPFARRSADDSQTRKSIADEFKKTAKAGVMGAVK